MLIQPHYKKKAAECVSVFCLPPMTRLRLLSGKKLAAKSAAKSAAAANAQKSLDQQLPAKCPAVATFLACDNSASAPPNARALLQQLEQCIQGGQAAIGQLEQLRARPNALALIREAFEADAESGAARDFVDKFVAQVKAQFELAKQIEKVMPSLLEELCSGSAPAQEENAPSERLLARNFAKLLELALRFDCLKAETPALQNGFSIYRRMSVASSFGAEQLYAHLGDQISLFLSRPTPLLCSLVNGTERFIGRQQCRQLAVAHVVEALLVIYNVLKHTLERRRQLNLNSGDGQAQNSVGDFVLRAMVALLLLYDHIEREPAGVFCPSNSPLDVTDFVALVQRNCSIEKAQQHLAGLRFMSRHFNDRETPSHVRKLFN